MLLKHQGYIMQGADDAAEDLAVTAIVTAATSGATSMHVPQ